MLNECARRHAAFTLIELSIVLVIIGLITGGILTGRDLIDAATVRAQISQVEKYQTAVNTFRGKYSCLPGDCSAAASFGFQPRGTFTGEGDGNGILESNCVNTAGTYTGFQVGCGENGVFWQDLSTAGLIDGVVPYTGQTGWPSTTTDYTTYLPALYTGVPNPKLGSGLNVMYVYSNGGRNYFGLSSAYKISYYLVGASNPNVTVQQAYNIDKKADDGLPQSGATTACYMNYNVSTSSAVWAAGNSLQGANGGTACTPTTTATAYLSTDCYDNGGVAGTQTYALAQNANLPNCALSFRFQ